MKIKWSVICSVALLSLIGCGKEEFGSTPSTNTSKAEPVKQFEQSYCAVPSVIRPKVDILFMVDNSKSTYYLADDIKSGIRNMMNTVSKDFDYRFIGTGLLATDTTPFNDYQVLTNSDDMLSAEASGKKIISANELNFFHTKPAEGVLEAGLRRGVEFVNANVQNNSGLFRQNANLIVVIFSNGRDTDVEKKAEWESGVMFDSAVYNQRLDSYKYIKNTLLNLTQLRLISMSAMSACQPGWFSSRDSYGKMANNIYDYSGASDSPAKDSYDLCNGVANIFAPVNTSIQMVKINHSYRYWPITFANSSNVRNDFGDISVFKINSGVSQVIPSTDWTYYEHTGSTALNIREPVPGEPVLPGGEVSGKHFIRLNTPVVSPPNCIQIKSSTRTEYFGYVVLNQEPKPDSINLRINGKTIPKSAVDGWSYVGNRMNQNIKMPFPAAGDQLPAVNKSGFMLELNGSGNFYRSGDSVEANFIAAPL
ncbi:MAG TPA: hypothetical protein VNJ08_13860 [Bacteriovoracaceae bacterium]|nr:hypothetical protein [Bacteriovoracaceae bacterium]